MKITHLVKMAASIFAFVGSISAEQSDLKYSYLYSDSSVNADLYSILYPIPDKYEFLSNQIISNGELDSIAREEMGSLSVYTLSGNIVRGRAASVTKNAVIVHDSIIPLKEIDYISFKEKKTVGGFFGTVGLTALFSGIFFGGLECYDLIFRNRYDYKNVLVYAGAVTSAAVVFYFPFRSTSQIGFKLK